ncbi:MAG: TolC family protein [Thermoanaerobaculaceae bacterium]|nr:TolC family protein [Thermoanaerobaculaceae bacterium]MDI9623243.1 TolC family protein [Acidobacteriota bacterium]NLH11292.1 TolC family protein [Holophagae bacterium]HPW56613.1 TolC family protein [Thermoanaerobaculaceae bacterium]
MRHSKNLAWVAVVVAGAVTILAEEPVKVVTTAGQQTRGARIGAPEMKLSMRDAVRLALGHNINLEVSRLGLAGSTAALDGSRGLFDPYFNAQGSTSESSTPSTNQLVGADIATSRRRNLDLSLGKLFTTGTEVTVGWTNSRSATNSSFYFLNPSYNTGFSLGLKQPLLRGFGTDVNRAGIEVARRNRDMSRLAFEQIVISTLQQVESAYWNLVYRIDNLAVKRQSLKLAQDLLDQTRTRVRIGTAAPIDIVQSEATVAAREQEIILAENQVDDAADLLKQLMGFENTDDWQSRIVPTDVLELQAEQVSLEAALDQALARRVELQQKQLETEIREVGLLTARNAALPALGVNVNYGYTGVDGTQTVRDSSGNVIAVHRGGWDDALRQVTDLDYRQWSAGFQFTYTLGNHDAKARMAQRRYELRSARQSLALQRQAVIADVRAAVRGLEAGAKSIAAAIKARELAERNLDAEQKKFANGMSTNYQVLQIQEDLAAALASELYSKVAFRIARVQYEVAIGRLPETMGVSIADDAPEAPKVTREGPSWLKYGSWTTDADLQPRVGDAGK